MSSSICISEWYKDRNKVKAENKITQEACTSSQYWREKLEYRKGNYATLSAFDLAQREDFCFKLCMLIRQLRFAVRSLPSFVHVPIAPPVSWRGPVYHWDTGLLVLLPKPEDNSINKPTLNLQSKSAQRPFLPCTRLISRESWLTSYKQSMLCSVSVPGNPKHQCKLLCLYKPFQRLITRKSLLLRAE